MQFAIHPDGELWTGPAMDSPEAVRPRGALWEQLPPELLAEDEEKTDPWARGACHFDLTREEWRRVRRALMLRGWSVQGARFPTCCASGAGAAG